MAVILIATAAHAQVGLDVSVSGAAVFSRTTNAASSSISDTPTKSGDVFGTVRYHFKPHQAAEINLGHTSNSQIFTVPPDTYRVTTGIFEYTAAYVFTPFNGKKWEPFLMAGGGGLKFGAGNTYIDTNPVALGARSSNSLAFLYGAGTDYRVFTHLALRLQYRGLIFKNPDFGLPSRFYTGAKGHMAEPAIGIVLKF
jgi:hypothetical protein